MKFLVCKFFLAIRIGSFFKWALDPSHSWQSQRDEMVIRRKRSFVSSQPNNWNDYTISIVGITHIGVSVPQCLGWQVHFAFLAAFRNAYLIRFGKWGCLRLPHGFVYMSISSLYIHWYIGWILGMSCDIITKQDGNLTKWHAAWPTTIEGWNGGHWTKWKIQNTCNDIVGSVLHGDFGFHGFQNVFQNGLPLFLQGDLPGPSNDPALTMSHHDSQPTSMWHKCSGLLVG